MKRPGNRRITPARPLGCPACALAVASSLLLILAPAPPPRRPTSRSAAPRTASRTSRRDDFGGPRLRLRLRVRPGQHLHDRRHLRDGRRASARSYFGPDATLRAAAATASTSNNLDSDFFFQRINDAGIVEKLIAAAAAARARCREIREACAATSRATTTTCASIGVDNLPDPRCRGKAWVRPIDRDRRLPALLPARAAGQPGRRDRRHRRRRSRRRRAAPARRDAADADAARRSRTLERRLPLGGDRLERLALGKRGDRATATGMLLGNPHFPWDGLRALLPGPPHDPRQDRRRRRVACSASR